ncbi:MAG: hypothetical protein RL660_1319 [Bacteroidota bacterium]|jgi:hypothetical protein
MKVIYLAILALLSFTNTYGQNLALHLNFDNNIVDQTGNNGFINSYGTFSYDTGYAGLPNTALKFDGVSNYLSIPDAAVLDMTNGFTIRALFKPQDFYTGTCHANYIVAKGFIQGGGEYGLYYSDDPYIRTLNANANGCNTQLYEDHETFVVTKNGVGQTNGLTNVPVTPTNTSDATTILNDYLAAADYIELNRWYCVNFTYDKAANVGKLYVDGNLVGINTTADPFVSNNPHPLTIGRMLSPNFPTYAYWFTGLLDDLKIYNYVDSQIVCQFPAEIDNAATPSTFYVSCETTGSAHIFYIYNDKQSAEIAEYMIVDLQGNVVDKGSFSSGTRKFTVSHRKLAVGMYICKVIDNAGKAATVKFTVK